jgi:hypothetical protein
MYNLCGGCPGKTLLPIEGIMFVLHFATRCWILTVAVKT